MHQFVTRVEDGFLPDYDREQVVVQLALKVKPGAVLDHVIDHRGQQDWY